MLRGWPRLGTEDAQVKTNGEKGRFLSEEGLCAFLLYRFFYFWRSTF